MNEENLKRKKNDRNKEREKKENMKGKATQK